VSCCIFPCPIYNGQMFRDEKNLKDTNLTPYPLLKGEGGVVSYTKTNKLITALYMVTDIIDSKEPLRNRLRTLGTGVISDMYLIPYHARYKISEIMSFLDIAVAINIISEMNYNILRKEFMELDRSIKESQGNVGSFNRQVNLAEFFEEEEKYPYPTSPYSRGRSKERVLSSRGEQNFKGHHSIGHTRIGVQKGSTLMQALSDKTMSYLSGVQHPTRTQDFLILKKQRRNDIISIIKNNGGGATITDIRTKIKADFMISFASCSEKTLQRELVSMTKDGVLNRTGEKRWSKYFIK